ncbi:Uncharacterised protein [Mycobacterium tuberculosis]|nr:Uncharacterised protein [Mycobacterium tuberculosis]
MLRLRDGAVHVVQCQPGAALAVQRLAREVQRVGMSRHAGEQVVIDLKGFSETACAMQRQALLQEAAGIFRGQGGRRGECR